MAATHTYPYMCDNNLKVGRNHCNLPGQAFSHEDPDLLSKAVTVVFCVSDLSRTEKTSPQYVAGIRRGTAPAAAEAHTIDGSGSW